MTEFRVSSAISPKKNDQQFQKKEQSRIKEISTRESRSVDYIKPESQESSDSFHLIQLAINRIVDDDDDLIKNCPNTMLCSYIWIDVIDDLEGRRRSSERRMTRMTRASLMC